MKLIHTLLIASIIYLWTLPVYSSTWEPEVEWVIEIEEGLVPWEFHIRSEHFNVKWTGDCPMLFERVVAYETVIHYALEEKPVATPEPASLLLLGSGLGVLVWRRKKINRSNCEATA